MSPARTDGSHLRWTEKRMMSIRPSQKLGMDTPQHGQDAGEVVQYPVLPHGGDNPQADPDEHGEDHAVEGEGQG